MKLVILAAAAIIATTSAQAADVGGYGDFLNASTVSCHTFAGTTYCDDGSEARTFFGDTHITSPHQPPVDCHTFAGTTECRGGDQPDWLLSPSGRHE